MAAYSRRRFPLSSHLLLLVVGTMLPVLLVTAFVVRRLVDDNRDMVERRLLEASRASAAAVDAEITGTIRTLQALGRSQRLDSRDLAAFDADARAVQAMQSTWSAVVLQDGDGIQLIDTRDAGGPPDRQVADAASVREVFVGAAPVIGNLEMGPPGAEPVLAVRVPVVRDGGVLFCLSAVISPAKLGDLLRQEHAFPDEWVRGIVDRNNVIVVRTRDQDRWIGQSSTPGFIERVKGVDEQAYRDRSLEGEEVYGAFSRATRSQWVAGVAVSAAMVDSDFRRWMWLLGALAAIALGLGGTAAYAIARRIARDISMTAEAADAIATGRPTALPDATVAEVQRLGDALVRASDLLKDRERERDARVSRADAARAEAEAADRAKDQFMAMLGHELRNPLAPALTALHVLRQRVGADARYECEVIERQMRHLARLVDDLLDVSRLRRGVIELRRRRVTVAEIVSGAVEMATPLLVDRRQELTVDVPPTLSVDGDPERLAQVFMNLLANAAKYTQPGGHVAITARDAEGWAVIECADDGLGIATDLLPRVFDLFVQGARGLDRRQGGLGLGLGVARTLVELHGGTIAATSPGPGAGSTFIVRLPAVQSALHPVAPAAADLSRPASAARVLLVEDNRDALEMMVQALTHSGLTVVGCPDAAAALREASTFMPQVAVLDIGLPEVDGYQLARQLRADEVTRHIRLIALTGYGRPGDKIAARDAGFDLFLVKPVSIDLLLGLIADLVTGSPLQK